MSRTEARSRCSTSNRTASEALAAIALFRSFAAAAAISILSHLPSLPSVRILSGFLIPTIISNN